jgi:hypothetical protein
MNDYQPRPIETNAIELSAEIQELIERLAENTHDVWARQRLQDGWTYGTERDDAGKKHPCLVPYAELSEAEKQYDRATAVQTLKAILALGYRIEKARKRRG